MRIIWGTFHNESEVSTTVPDIQCACSLSARSYYYLSPRNSFFVVGYLF